MTKRLTGKEVAQALQVRAAENMATLRKKGIVPTLAIVRVGEREDDVYYQNAANKTLRALGANVVNHNVPGDLSPCAFEELLEHLNTDPHIHGILVLRPLPKTLAGICLEDKLSVKKDIEGLCYVNAGKLFCARDCFSPITPLAVMELLQYYKIPLQGKRVVLVGRSLVVGKPLAMMLLEKNATLTIAHSKTEHLKEVCKEADVLITAIGKARFFNAEYVKQGAVVIDVGTNTDAQGRFCGDCDSASIERVCSAFTPVPGGVGTVTNTVLFGALVKACMMACE